MDSIITAIGTLMTSLLGWITTVLGDLIAQPLVLFFLALAVCGIVFRYAKGFLHIR